VRMLKDFFDQQEKIFNYFGYVEDWKVIPLDDRTEFYWELDEIDNTVKYAETLEELKDDADYYEDTIYQQRFLPKYIYEGLEYTMISVDTQTDGNKFLAVFDNKKKV